MGPGIYNYFLGALVCTIIMMLNTINCEYLPSGIMIFKTRPTTSISSKINTDRQTDNIVI